MRKLISLILALSLVFSCICSVAFAEALKEDPKAKKSTVSKLGKDDLAIVDFTDVEEGELPDVISTSNSEDVYTEIYEVGPGQKKNCLVIDDKSHDNSYTGPSVAYNFGPYKGKLEVTMRYKFIKTGENDWCSFVMGYNSYKGMFSRTVVASSNGVTYFNYGGPGSWNIDAKRISNDTWYTLTYLIDFNGEGAKYLNATLLNEGTNTSVSANNGAPAGWYEGSGHQEISSISFASSVYGGKYVFDYIRIKRAVSEEDEIIDGDPYADIKKGVEQIRIPAPVNGAVEGRVNVTHNGSYKYTTLAPYVAENGSIMITAKNLADMFGMGYLRQGTKYTITAEDTELEFKADSLTAVSNKKSITLKDKTVASGTQLYIPAEVICDALGLEYSYDAATQTFEIITPIVEEGGMNDE